MKNYSRVYIQKIRGYTRRGFKKFFPLCQTDVIRKFFVKKFVKGLQNKQVLIIIVTVLALV